jgi:biopolymer transport protein ExbB/TolQ
VQALVEDTSLGMAHDLSPWGMYKNADIVVKIVMIGLAIASIITWTIWIAKGFELMGAKRRLRGEIAALKRSVTLKEASEVSNKEGTLAHPGARRPRRDAPVGQRPRKKASRNASASAWSAWWPPAAAP